MMTVMAIYDDAVDKFCGDIGDMNERRGSDDEEQDGEHNNEHGTDGNGDVDAFNPGLESRSPLSLSLSLLSPLSMKIRKNVHSF
jgi:hypothetical protein